MKSVVFPMAPAARQSRQSMALILTLAILALLSILLVAFVSTAALDRGATASYSQALPADQIAQGGLDQIVSQFKSEIADPALSTNSYVVVSGVTNNLYVPLANAYAVPQRTAPAAANLATLLSYSGVPLYTIGAGASNYSSSSLTQTPSLNGRSVSTANWNKPQLTTSTANFPSPKWILMTRCGPTNGSGLSFGATTANSVANNSALNANYVVGRYAYVVYDTSGLLDANVAGYPSGAAANASGKGLLPWADLTQLSSSISQADIDKLVNWRNATTASPATSYVTNVSTAATNNGFTRVANGDTCFLGRQDLIKYATTQNTDLVGALPYLTTFSRELNGPTWGPTVNGTGASYQYAANQYTSGSFNPRIPNPRVQAPGGWPRANGLLAVAGEPLVKYRFPLDKLALLEKFTGQASATSAGSLTSADITNIQKYFGLDLATNAAPYPIGPSYRHWNYPTTSTTYVHNAGTSGANGIMSLDDVAAQNREPDFFELLQAGILSGSLGVPGKNSTTGYANTNRYDRYPLNTSDTSSFVDPDDSATLQTLRIGANIIDQWGAENFPTTITYTQNGGNPINVEGIKDLPYAFAAYFNVTAASGFTGTAGTIATPLPPFNFYLYFALWNPHQMPSSVNQANYPTAFRFFPFYNKNEDFEPALTLCDSFVAGFANNQILSKPGTEQSWFYNGGPTKNGPDQFSHTNVLMIASAPSGIPFTYSPTTAATDYREPTLAVGTAVGGTAPSPWNTNACLVLPPLTNFPPSTSGHPANHDGSVNFPAISSGVGGPNAAWFCQYEMRMVMPIQYQDAANNWHTYTTFMGLDDQGGAYSSTGGTYYQAYPAFGWSTPSTTPSLSCGVVMKSDPRTFRFGGGFGSGSPDVNVPLANASGMAAGTTMPPLSFAPFGTATRIDKWVANDGTVTSPPNPYYSDVDGVERWGDAHHSYPSGSPVYTGAAANRPVVLNRPFQSVGEMGYAFRDTPWKTLDLFSANSADSALLDLFALNDSPMLAGRVSPNTPYPQVLAALISGATQSTVNSTTVSSANALAIGQAIQSTTAVTPFVTRADVVNDFMTNTAISNMSAIKTEEEAAVRSVAESANTRTWTFMIDIIAQSGRYPATAGSLDNFVVEGERRYWLHVSIDRYTGQVVDKQLEVVNE